MTNSGSQESHSLSDKVSGNNLGQNTTKNTSENNISDSVTVFENSQKPSVNIYKLNQKKMFNSALKVNHTSSDKVISDNLGKNTEQVVLKNIEPLNNSDINNPLITEFSSEVVDTVIHNDKYHRLLDRLSDDEFKQLKSSIEEKGCKDPLTVDENFNLLDGHHRLEICRFLKVPYRVIRMSFPKEEDKINYILSYHFARRLLNELQKSDIRGRMYNALKKTNKEKGNQYTKSPSAKVTRSKRETAKILEDKFLVSSRTIKRDGKTNESLNKIKEQIEAVEGESLAFEIRQKITKQEIPINKLCLEKIYSKPNDFFTFVVNTLIQLYKKDKRTKTDERKIGKQLNKIIRDFGKKQVEPLTKEKPDIETSMKLLKNAIDTLSISDILSKCILKANDFFVFENDKVRITLSTK